MPRRSSFYASPRGLAVCMTLTWVSKKGGYWLNCVCISAFCGSERIGTSDGSLERRKKSGRLQNGLNPHWNSRANVHTYTHSVSLGSLVCTVRYSRVFPSPEIFSIYSTLSIWKHCLIICTRFDVMWSIHLLFSAARTITPDVYLLWGFTCCVRSD